MFFSSDVSWNTFNDNSDRIYVGDSRRDLMGNWNFVPVFNFVTCHGLYYNIKIEIIWYILKNRCKAFRSTQMYIINNSQYTSLVLNFINEIINFVIKNYTNENTPL